jgi:hypothetical protein
VFYGVFFTEEAYEIGDKGSGDTTLVDGSDTLGGAFLNVSLKSACFIDEAFFC